MDSSLDHLSNPIFGSLMGANTVEEFHRNALPHLLRIPVICLRFEMDLLDTAVGSRPLLQINLEHKLAYVLSGIASQRDTDRIATRVVFAVAPAQVKALKDLLRGSNPAADASIVRTVEGSYGTQG